MQKVHLAFAYWAQASSQGKIVKMGQESPDALKVPNAGRKRRGKNFGGGRYLRLGKPMTCRDGLRSDSGMTENAKPYRRKNFGDRAVGSRVC